MLKQRLVSRQMDSAASLTNLRFLSHIPVDIPQLTASPDFAVWPAFPWSDEVRRRFAKIFCPPGSRWPSPCTDMTFFSTLVAFVVALGLLIVFHEFGHYLVARWCGVKVMRFSIGFGHPLLRKRWGKDETEWVVACFSSRRLRQDAG